MDETILVNFHCHTIFSDGQPTPEILAGNLATAGVRYAALTDHDTLEGLPRFRDALKKQGIAFLPGVELTTQFNGREAHLLGYGFDPDHPDLNATLRSLRQVQNVEIHSIAGTIRKAGNHSADGVTKIPAVSAAPDGKLEISAAIDLIHRAGGFAFWAHPLLFESNLDRLGILSGELKSMGLDGLEAIFSSFSDSEQDSLRTIANNHDLLLCAGTDFHGIDGLGSQQLGIGMPKKDWINFRNKVFSGSTFSLEAETSGNPSGFKKASNAKITEKPHHFRKRSYILRIFLPTFIAIALFLAAFWGLILPSLEQTLLNNKRELIRELTNSAWSILASYQHDEQNGILSHEQAQNLAITRIEALRYGTDLKDYFWIQDMQPVMIMHPYRTDLNGEDLHSFTDPRGAHIFVEFANLVQREGEGYIDYVWQWNDNPDRLEPKESFVKGFVPWNWIIGTGIYIDDVEQEIARIEKSLINTSLLISGAIVLLLLFVLQQSLRIEKERQEVVDSLQESTERYHALIEATTEGTLLVLNNQCSYANPIFLSMLGYSARQLEFLQLNDLLPSEEYNDPVWERIQRISLHQPEIGKAIEGCLRRSDGHLVECIITINPIIFAEQRGFIMMSKDITRQPESLKYDGLAEVARLAPIGIFRAQAARRGVFLEINSAGESFLPHHEETEMFQPALADLFSVTAEYEQFFQSLLSEKVLKNYKIHVSGSDASIRSLSVSARLILDENNRPATISGIFEDITDERKKETERDHLIEKLQSSLLFLHEPVSNLGRDVVICPMDTSIRQLSRIMTTRKVTAALVASETSLVIGIITDHDLRARVITGSMDYNLPIHTIMSAPITKIRENALIYEALLLMEEKGVSHLAVEDDNGQIVSVIDSKALIQFQSYGPIVLSREISQAGTPEDLVNCCKRIPSMVKTLIDNSARTRHVTNLLASVCDAATERLIQIAINELGSPPGTFAFMAMGSQGRYEQTLLTDQDNGIIYVANEDTDPEMAANYFLNLGNQVCAGLNKAGYKLCQGNVMARNPKWCRPLEDWIIELDEWLQKSEPEDIMDLSILFDARPVYGDPELIYKLRRNIQKALINDPAYFHHAARNALSFKPPLRLPGNIYLSGGVTEHSGEINLKDAMMPIVSFARLYALRYQLNETHTLDRINALVERNIIIPASRDEISTAYDFLMRLRLQNQLEDIQNDGLPRNVIHPGKLGHIQRELLKQAYTQISAIQKKISYDFLGGM